MKRKILIIIVSFFALLLLLFIVINSKKDFILDHLSPDDSFAEMIYGRKYKLMNHEEKVYVSNGKAIYAKNILGLSKLKLANKEVLIDVMIRGNDLYFITDEAQIDEYSLYKQDLKNKKISHLFDLNKYYFLTNSGADSVDIKLLKNKIFIHSFIFNIDHYDEDITKFIALNEDLEVVSKDNRKAVEKRFDQYLFNLETLNETYCYKYEFDGSSPETETLQYYEIFDCESGKFIEKIKFDLSGLIEKYSDPEAQYTSFRHKLISYQPDHWVIDAHRFTSTDNGMQQFLVTKNGAKKYMEGDVIDFEEVPLRENIILDSIAVNSKVYSIVLEGKDVKLMRGL